MDTRRLVLLIRADASREIGIGHVLRCLALAEAWADAGGQVRFVSAGCQSMLRALRSEFDLCWLGDEISVRADDALRFLDIAREACADAVVLDSYSHDIAWESQVRAAGLPLLAVDDLASRQHDCDVVLDTSIGPEESDRYRGSDANVRILLLGPKYVLLRRAFRQGNFAARSGGPVRRLLVSFGGADVLDYTSAALEAIALLQIPGIKVDVVASSANPNLTTLRKLAVALPGAIFHVDTQNMVGLMEAADLALGTAGGTSWERCRVGLPSLVVIAAPNQLGVANRLASEGVVRIVSGERIGLASRLGGSLLAALRDGRWRASASWRAINLVDGCGAGRVVDQLLRLLKGARKNAELELRLVTPDDASYLWAWRNDAATRAMSRDSSVVSWDTHVAWFTKRLAHADTLLLIGLSGGRPAGVVRFDRHSDGSAEVSINVAPEHRGQGLGLILLIRGCKYAEQTGFARVFDAEIRSDNTHSLRLFEEGGFERVTDDRIWARYRRGAAAKDKDSWGKHA